MCYPVKIKQLHKRCLMHGNKKDIKLGIKVVKVNKVLEYDQHNYTKPYFMLSTKMRIKATT